jgi:hypothetical protein
MVGKADDELEDLLCEVVARGRLCAEEVGVRGILGVRVLEQPLVYGEDVQRVHVLALVLVQALDLYVENAVRVNDLALRALNVLGKALLVVQLDRRSFSSTAASSLYFISFSSCAASWM